MADIEKPTADLENVEHRKSITGMDAVQQENAVGYKEYHEALELEFSDKEVHLGFSLSNVKLTNQCCQPRPEGYDGNST